MTDTEQAEDNTDLENNENAQPSSTDVNGDSNTDSTSTSIENSTEPDENKQTEPEADSEVNSTEKLDSNDTDSGEIMGKEEVQDDPHQGENTSDSDVEATVGSAEETSGVDA